MFIAILLAFSLTNWGENRRERDAANKIVQEIGNGLKMDIVDIRVNILGHKSGLEACNYWHRVINNKAVNQDSIQYHYFNLTRDFVSIQNISGYETLKSRGLELLKNDELRFSIISLYEYEYNTLRKLEEEYHETQFQENYFAEINRILSPHFTFDAKGALKKVNSPIQLTPEEKNLLLSYLWKIRNNRGFMLQNYASVENKIDDLLAKID